MASYDTIDYAALFRSVNRDQAPPDATKPRGFMRGGADLGLEVASGVTRGVGMLANVFGANNAVSQGARSADEFIREYLSAQSKEDSARVAEILAEAEDAGVGAQVVAGLRAFGQAPLSMMANTLGIAVPTIAGGMAAMGGRAAAGGARALGTMAGIGGASGVGEAKGGIFEAVKNEQQQAGMTEADATAAAEAAQAYGGPNTGNLALAGGIGALSGATGFQPAAARVLTRGGGMLSAATEQIEQGLVRRMSKGALVEGGTEFLQEGQQAYAQNIALQNEGFDVPAMRGVVAQGTMGAVAGGMLGGGFGALDRKRGEKPSEPSIKDIADAPTVDDAIKAFTDVLALPAPATKTDWEVVDGQQLLEGPGRPPAPPPAAPRLPGPTEPPTLMVDQFGNVTTQPATARAEAVSRANMAAAEADQAAAAQRRRTQELGKQTARGESPPERIPVGEATRFDAIPTGEATELIPAGEATEFEQVPTGDAAELDVETIQADDFLTGDGQPYGTKSGASMRARKEGLNPADAVVAVQGGWVVRPQPTALSQPGQEVRPNNTRGTNAADVLKAPSAGQPEAAAVEPSAGAAPAPDIPAEGTPLTLDGKPYTVAAAGKRYVTIADASGKERVISDGSHLWPRVRDALKPGRVQQTPVSSTDAPAPVPKAGKAVQVTLFRGVKGGQDPRATDGTAGNALFMSPDEQVAKTYAGDGGVVDRREITFTNLLDVPRWTDAKSALGLQKSATMADIIKAARDAGHDGLSFVTTNGKEYVDLGAQAAPSAEQPAQAQPGGTPSEGAASTQPTPGLEAPPVVTGRNSSEEPATLKDRLAAASKAKKANTVYKTRRAAEEARTGNTQRLRKTKDGYILRDATDKELAAAEKAGRRLARASVDVEKDSLLTAIAKLGGLSITERSDTIGEGNRNIGGKMLFTRTGQALDTLADGALREYGYVPQQEVDRDGGVRWLRDAIKSEFNNGTEHFSEQGLDAIMQREQAEQEAEFMASQEAEDIFAGWDADEVQASGYTSASPEVQAATEQAVAEAMAQGVDVEFVRERVAVRSEGLTQDEYEIAVQQALAEAIAQTRTDDGRADASTARAGNEDRGEAADSQGQEEGLTLEAQDSEGLRTKTEREAKAKADEAKAKTAEQERLRREAEAREVNDRARQDASAENFQLGQSAEDALAGQGGLFDAPADAPAPPSRTPARNEALIALRKRASVLESLRKCLG